MFGCKTFYVVLKTCKAKNGVGNEAMINQNDTSFTEASQLTAQIDPTFLSSSEALIDLSLEIKLLEYLCFSFTKPWQSKYANREVNMTFHSFNESFPSPVVFAKTSLSFVNSHFLIFS